MDSVVSTTISVTGSSKVPAVSMGTSVSPGVSSTLQVVEINTSAVSGSTEVSSRTALTATVRITNSGSANSNASNNNQLGALSLSSTMINAIIVCGSVICLACLFIIYTRICLKNRSRTSYKSTSSNSGGETKTSVDEQSTAKYSISSAKPQATNNRAGTNGKVEPGGISVKTNNTANEPIDIWAIRPSPVNSNATDTNHDSKNNKSQSNGSNGTFTTGTSAITQVAGEMGLSIPGYLECAFGVDFRPERQLSAGAFGAIFLATVLSDKLLERVQIQQSQGQAQERGQKLKSLKVIVKQLKKERPSDRETQLFYQELSLMEYFKPHPNVAKLYGYTTSPLCMVMKFYIAGSLGKYLAGSRKRPRAQATLFSRDIANGILALHDKGVVHLDLKPDNILLDVVGPKQELHCVLTDFGISQIVSSDILMVKEFQIAEIKALSMAYAAPERLVYYRTGYMHEGLRSAIPSWDIYAFAIIIHRLICTNDRSS
jgi:tRNA A-37 threonylcarbamoyl transferase component Bud32